MFEILELTRLFCIFASLLICFIYCSPSYRCPICMKDIECEKARNSSLAIDHAYQSPDLIEPPSLTHSHLPDYPLGNGKSTAFFLWYLIYYWKRLQWFWIVFYHSRLCFSPLFRQRHGLLFCYTRIFISVRWTMHRVRYIRTYFSCMAAIELNVKLRLSRPFTFNG